MEKHLHDQRFLELLQQWLDVGIMETHPPANDQNWITSGGEKVTDGLRKGLDWTLSNFTQSNPDNAHPYEFQGGYLMEDGAEKENNMDNDEPIEDVDWYKVDRTEDEYQRQVVQKQAIQKIATSGVILGSSMAKRRDIEEDEK